MRIQKSSQIADMISDYNNVTEVLTNEMSSPILRYVRASGDEIFASVIENMEKVARLTTGISIQVGLNAGTIKPEDLIPELLHFGAVTLDQINSMDPAKLQGALTELKNLPTALKDTPGLNEVEKKLEELKKIRETTDKVGDGTKWVGKETFDKEMQLLKNGGNTVQEMENFSGFLDDWFTFYKKLKDPKNTIEKKRNYVEDFKKAMEGMLPAINTLANSQDKLKYPTIESAVTALEPFTGLIEFVEQILAKQASFSPGAPDEDINFNLEIANLNRVAGLSKSLGLVLPDLNNVKILVESRAQSTKSLKFPGFSNGFSDLEMLFDDLSDDWLKKVVKINTLPEAMKSLKSLIKTFRSVEKTLGPADDEKGVMISELLEDVEEIRGVEQNTPEIEKAFKDMWKCKGEFRNLPKPDSQAAQEFIDSAKDLDAGMVQMKTHLTKFLNEINTDEMKKLLNEIKGLCKTDADNNKMTGLLKALVDSKSLTTLHGKLVSAKALGDHVLVPKAAVDKVIQKSSKTETYLDSIKPFATLFTCLRNANADLVTKGIRMSRQYRGAKRRKRDSKVVTDAENVINGVVNSVPDLKTLKTDIEKVKGKATPESKVLSTLPDPDKHSMTIGLAAQGMSSMKKAEDNKDQVDLIIKHSPVITKYKANADPADQPILEGVIQLSAPLTAMLQSMNVWKTGIIPTNSTVLVDLFGVISSAKAVTGVPGDFGAMAKSVGNLADNVTDPTAKRELRIVQKALETLHRIGLNFASYAAQFTASKDSLAALDVFFVNAKAALTSPSQSGGGAGGNGNGNQGHLALPNTTPASDPTVIIVCVVLGILGFGGAGGAGYYFWKKNAEKKKNKNKKSDTEDEKKPVDGGEKVSGSGTGTESKATDVEAGHKPDEKAAPAPPAEAPKPPPAPPADPPPPQGPQEIIPAPMIAEHYEEVLIKKINKHKAMLQAEENIRARAAGQRPKKFDQLDALKSFCTKLLAAADMEKIDFSPLVVKHMNECRRKMALREKTRVILKFEGKRFPTTFMHANYVNFPSGLRMILAQAPQKASPGKLSTIEKFWWMAKQEKSEYIVMLAKSGENEGKSCDGYLPAEVGQVDKFENLTVTCINKEMEGDRSVLIRTLEVQFVGEEMFTIKHCEFTEWPDHGAPEASGMVINLLRRVRESKTPVIVHCSAGVGRSGTFAYIELAYQILCLKFNVNLAAVLEELRAQRCDAIQTPIQLAFAMVCLNWYISLHFSGQLKDSKCQSIQDVYVVWAREPIEERKEEKKEEKKVVAKEDNTKTEQATQRTEQATLRSEQVTQRSTAGSEFEELEVFYSDDEWILEEAEQTDWPVTWVIEELEEEN